MTTPTPLRDTMWRTIARHGIITGAALFAAMLLVAALSGCSDPGAPATATDPVAAATESAPASKAPDHVKFGQTWAYADGVKLTVKANGAAKASQWASGAEDTNGQIAVFTATVTNGTDSVFDTSLTTVDVVYGAKGTPAADVFDEHYTGTMTGKVLPGKSRTVKMAYAIPAKALGDVTMTYGVDFDHGEAIYTGSAK